VSVRYLVQDELVPNDGSREIIARMNEQIRDPSLEILVFPDVHYKKGAKVTNGLLTLSDRHIIPAMLGVANCGFTFGKIENPGNHSDDAIVKTFVEYAKRLKAYNHTPEFDRSFVRDQLRSYAAKLLTDESAEIISFFGFTPDEFVNAMDDVIPESVIELARSSLGTLGGGNHFFELHTVEEVYDADQGVSKGDIIFILHTDSISVGEKINLLYSNLSELSHLRGLRKAKAHLMERKRQISYFLKNRLLMSDPIELRKLLFSSNDYRTIQADSKLGRSLILAFTFASVFGEMNRDMILQRYLETAKTLIPEINCHKFGSHSHDSLKIEKVKGNYKIAQRNGVQHVGGNSIYVLPGALGTDSFLMKNSYNEDAHYSVNHGVGRVLDKHLAKEEFSASGTEEVLQSRKITLLRVGNGDISEQHPQAFKNVAGVIESMEANRLGTKLAKLRPLASMKG
jgi:RNA-splicing ligase RtcB